MELERKPALRAAPARTVQYGRRRPEQTLLHRLVREHLETFLPQVEARAGTGLPEFVKDEFEAFLECGILAHGFLRVRCAECAHEKLVAFSCKRRGFCPSCGARRMAQSAAHLVDRVIPRVPVRQWVLSFPVPLRILFAAHPELLTPVLRIIHRVIDRDGGDITECLADGLQVARPKAKQVGVPCRPVRHVIPEREQQGAFEQEAIPVRRLAQAVQESLQGIADQKLVEVRSFGLCDVQQACPYRRGEVFGHSVASR